MFLKISWDGMLNIIWDQDMLAILFEEDRDLNAALNIRDWGLSKYLSTVGTTGTHACGDTTIGVDSNESTRYVSLNQEAFDASASR